MGHLSKLNNFPVLLDAKQPDEFCMGVYGWAMPSDWSNLRIRHSGKDVLGMQCVVHQGFLAY